MEGGGIGGERDWWRVRGWEGRGVMEVGREGSEGGEEGGDGSDGGGE